MKTQFFGGKVTSIRVYSAEFKSGYRAGEVVDRVTVDLQVRKEVPKSSFDRLRAEITNGAPVIRFSVARGETWFPTLAAMRVGDFMACEAYSVSEKNGYYNIRFKDIAVSEKDEDYYKEPVVSSFEAPKVSTDNF